MLALSKSSIRQLAGDELGLVALHEAWERTIRALHPAANGDLEAHLLRLDATSRRARFGADVSDAFLLAHARSIGEQPGAQVFAALIEGRIRAAVEMRPLGSEWCREAELAFSVETAWQGRGIGTALMAAAVRAARERDIAHLYLCCHAENRRNLRIVERLAAKVQFEDCECFADIAIRWQGLAPAFAAGAWLGGTAQRVLALDL
jgi:RimJ/RimL family protein N-acetyltransferase